MCKHRSALFMEKRKSLSLLVCNVCHQPFWKDTTGREIADKELIAKLEGKIPPTEAIRGSRREGGSH